MRAVFVVVANILREEAFQVAFVNSDDVIQEITAATPYPTLCDSILPRTFERGAVRIHPQGSNRCGDFPSILGKTCAPFLIAVRTCPARGGRQTERRCHS